MSLTRGRSPTSPNTGSPVPLRSKLANRFYEPIVLLVGLNVAWGDHQISKAPDLSSDVAQSSEHAFHGFVNKLGQLCDSERGGKTVTAFVVLQFPDRIQYRFASNQREKADLIRAQSFIKYVLHAIGTTNACELREMTSHILRRSLSFTRPRVGAYVKSLKRNTNLCISSCEREGTEESKSILGKLEELRELLRFSDDTSLDDNAFSKHCESLINAIDQLYKSEVEQLIRNKTNEGRMNESEYWCELRHAAGRLLSYLNAIKFLVSTRKRWPELFENFEVCYIPSSLPAKCPLRNKNKVGGLSMGDIIGRMTSDPTTMEKYRAHAQELEKFEVDTKIQKLAGSKTFRPIVHAEVLVLESLERDGSTRTSRFFGGYRYIGCSKPTCRLCDYYFSFHASGFVVRPTHRNLYLSWRMPDVYHNQGARAVDEREKLMIKILALVREDTFRTLIEKVPEGKLHDSNTEPTYPIDSIPTRELEDIDHLATTFDAFSIGSRDEATPDSSPGGSFDAVNFSEAESDGEEEDGGVKL